MLGLVARPWVRLIMSITFLITALWFTNFTAVVQHFSDAHRDGHSGSTGWILLAALATVPQYLLSARRWQLTAQRLELDLPYVMAVKAYYQATFFNQVLPGGVLGDVARAVDHGRATRVDQRFAAWRAVAIERLAGQLILIMAVILTLPVASSAMSSRTDDHIWSGTLVAGLLMFMLVVGFGLKYLPLSARLRASIQTLAADITRAWWGPGLFARQMLLSMFILASYILSYAALALAFGFSGDMLWLASSILLVLASMTLPVSVAGWGIREMSAAGLWLTGGHDPSAGVAIAVAYGLLNLVCSLPGLYFLRHNRVAH